MLARLINAISPPRAPSALLVVGKFETTIHVLHLLPEDDTIERFGLTTSSSTTTFRHGGATEQAREQIGAVDGETTTSFLDDVETRARKMWNGSLSSSPAQMQTGNVETTQLVQDVLRPAALDAIPEREGRGRSMHATQMYPVFVVRIIRSRAGRILTTKPTSFPQ